MSKAPHIDKKVCVSGTFDFLHEGHIALLKKAFEYDQILVGLTSDNYCSKKENVSPYVGRFAALNKYIKSQFRGTFEIIQINDKFGFATKIGELEVIVVSEETEKTAKIINEKRIEKRMTPLLVISIPIIKNKGKKISSTRIRKSK